MRATTQLAALHHALPMASNVHTTRRRIRNDRASPPPPPMPTNLSGREVLKDLDGLEPVGGLVVGPAARRVDLLAADLDVERDVVHQRDVQVALGKVKRPAVGRPRAAALARGARFALGREDARHGGWMRMRAGGTLRVRQTRACHVARGKRPVPSGSSGSGGR